MSIELPVHVASYFAADQGADASAITSLFTRTAIVTDEGHIYAGREAIRRWKIASSEKYNYRVEPFAISVEAEVTVVRARLTGDFPGSPVNLRYCFALDGNKIAGLEIAP